MAVVVIDGASGGRHGEGRTTGPHGDGGGGVGSGGSGEGDRDTDGGGG